MHARVLEFGDGLSALVVKDAAGWRIRAWRVTTVRRGREVYKASPPALKDVHLRTRFTSVEEARWFLTDLLKRAGIAVKAPQF